MQVLKTKDFTRFARKERIADEDLCEAIARANRGLIDAHLEAAHRQARAGRSRGF